MRIVARDVLSAYPDFNEEFKIYTDAINFQLVTVIIQNGKPIALYIGKLTGEQMSYTTTEKWWLNSVEGLKEFRTILPSKILRIYTDHKNLTCKFLNTDRVLIWRLII